MVVRAVETEGSVSVAQLHAWMLRQAIERSPAVREYRDFYAGKQPHSLTAEQIVTLEGLVLDGTGSTATASEGATTSITDDFAPDRSANGGGAYLCDNVTRIVVNTVRGRLTVAGFSCADEAVARAVHLDWALNGLDDLQNDTHRNALRDGDAYVMLGWDDEKKRPLITGEQAWVADDGAASQGIGVHVVYDGMRTPLVAIKEWIDDAGPRERWRRRNLYYPDRIERWASPIATIGGGQGGQWEPFPLDSDNGQWPVPWVDPLTRAPLGIPVVAFKNERDNSDYGVSELAGSVLGLQRAYNDTLHGLLAAGRMSGYQMYAAMGISEAEAQQWKVGPAQIWGSNAAGGHVTPMAGAELTSLINQRAHILRSVSHNTDLPVHAFTGEWPSGEALMRVEKGLVGKAEDRQKRYGRAWASVMHKATLLRNAFGGEALDADALIATRWIEAELRDEQYKTDVVISKLVLLSPEEALRELKYPDDKIQQIMKEKQAQAERESELRAREAMAARPPAAPAPTS